MPGTRKLGRTTDHRRAMLRGLVTYLFENGKVETTVTRAKEVRAMAEKMITIAKEGSLHSRRQVLAYVTKEDVVKKLFDEIAPKYQDVKGGYTRIIKTGARRGDAAEMAIIELVEPKAAEEKPANSMWYAYWPKPLASHDSEAIAEWKKEHKEDVEVYKVIQFFFDVQWNELKAYANENGISLIGDIPIFVAPDSADVWSNQKYFQLDENGKPNCVAGVPPDYFCADGQLWGNPLYDWDAMKASGYDWWIKRIKRIFELTDVLRIDHFRGFEAYWSVPFGAPNAIGGQWKKGPGIDLFKAIKRKVGDVPVIAEDLGVITDEVRALRDETGYPGMKVLQFAYSPDEAKQNGMVNSFMPHMFTTDNCVVYTGTHDNDTLQGWLELISDEQLVLVAEYMTGSKLTVAAAKKLVASGALRKLMIKTVLASSAVYAVIPMQDIIGCGNEARMNMPSTTGSNWTWRMNKADMKKNAAQELSFLTALYGRYI